MLSGAIRTLFCGKMSHLVLTTSEMYGLLLMSINHVDVRSEICLAYHIGYLILNKSFLLAPIVSMFIGYVRHLRNDVYRDTLVQ